MKEIAVRNGVFLPGLQSLRFSFLSIDKNARDGFLHRGRFHFTWDVRSAVPQLASYPLA
jgi:hypothetical protein